MLHVGWYLLKDSIPDVAQSAAFPYLVYYSPIFGLNLPYLLITGSVLSPSNLDVSLHLISMAVC